MSAWVYILASRPYETLYTGVTTDLARRIYEHREGLIEGFSERYGVKSLVWYENYPEIATAIKREKKQIIRWRRKWKFELIEAMNPRWDDLYLALNC
ncbi:GIY-YIG nuclease family protein [Roseibium salinum]|nr:GIY-YIG nuclease family protein [Roseibium salinum]